MNMYVVATDKGGYTDIIDHNDVLQGSGQYIPIKSAWDYAYCKSTYHDTDVHRHMWPNPTLKDVVDTLEDTVKRAKETRAQGVFLNLE